MRISTRARLPVLRAAACGEARRAVGSMGEQAGQPQQRLRCPLALTVKPTVEPAVNSCAASTQLTWMLARSNSESQLTSTPLATASSSSLGSLPLPLKMVLQA